VIGGGGGLATRRQRPAAADGVDTTLTSVASYTATPADAGRDVGVCVELVGVDVVGTGAVCVGVGSGGVMTGEAAGTGAR
jgi:hypothetical protein